MMPVWDRDVSPPPASKRRRFALNVDDCSPGSELKERNSGKCQSMLRVYSWNVDGISPFLQKPITAFFGTQDQSATSASRLTASLRTFLRRHRWPEVVCLQEVKIAATDESTQAAFRKAINAREDGSASSPRYEVCYTLPTDKYNARGWGGKVYGVATIIRQDVYKTYVTSVREVEWDREGRVHVLQIGAKLVVYNVYAVNGTDNPYKDPQTGAVTGTRHDRKLRFHELLLEDCKIMVRKGHDVVIIGDLNVAPARVDGHPNLRSYPEQHVRNRADFNRKFLDASNLQGLQAVDLWRHLKGNEKRYTYHPRGVAWGSSCDRVDLILATKQLAERGDILDVQIFDSPQERGPSDHVPLMVEVRSPTAGV